MSLPERKQNRLYNYDYSSSGAYFITICTRDRKKILSEIVGADTTARITSSCHNTEKLLMKQ